MAREVVHETEHPYLWLLGSGAVPSNYLDVLASDQVKSAVDSLLQYADVVLFDAPALDQEQDAQLLAKTINQVVLIAESARATPESIARATEMVQNTGAIVATVVVNKVRRPWHSYLLQWPWSRERRLEARALTRRQRKADATGGTLAEEQVSPGTAD
jgi:Mrp family chromosome partitioning ATPase